MRRASHFSKAAGNTFEFRSKSVPNNHGDLEDKVEQLFTDMYIGKDKDNPSVTTRLALMEDSVQKMTARDQKFFWLLIATLAGVLANLVKVSIH